MHRRSLCALGALALFTPALAAPRKPSPPRKPAAKPAPAKPQPAPSRPMAFNPAELDLAPGETYTNELFVPSPTGKAVTGKLAITAPAGLTVKDDPRWTGRVPPWGVKVYPKITAAADASGELPVEAILDKGGKAKLLVRVQAPLVNVTPGEKKLTVMVTNPFKSRLMTGRVQASNPDRFLQDITSLEFKLAPGASTDLVFPLPGAAPAEGEMYDFTILLQTYQGYKDEKTHKLAFPPQEEK
jgi:hypothetical protein